MRLINTRTLKLEEFFDNIPHYAILSHTWGDEEVTFQNMCSLNPMVKAGLGYEKITKTCQLALNRNIRYAWIDTCCIDKTSSAELTESINSMYEFYTLARVCFVHLADLPAQIQFDDGIGKCRWITRGWTLQEMIASANVEFYDNQWKFRGTKVDFRFQLSECTGVPKSVLNNTSPVASYSVAQRMSWASRRKTTRVEDMAYCLFGIFQVNMPLIYGERHMAFRRLQEEIIKHTNDTTIFAWNPSTGGDSSFCSIFAPSPANFRDGKMIEPWSRQSHDPEYTLTNKGLRMQEYLYILKFRAGDLDSDQDNRETNYVLALGTYDEDSGKQLAIGIQLRKIGPDLFTRRNRIFVLLDQRCRRKCPVTPESPFYTMADILEPAVDDLRRFRQKAIRFIGEGSQFIPHGLWDDVDRCFLNGLQGVVRGFLIGVKLKAREEEIGVLIEWNRDTKSYDFLLFNTAFFERQTSELFFGQLNFQETKQRLRWRDFGQQFPEMKNLTNKLNIKSRGSVFVITATSSLGLEEIQGSGPTAEMFRFGLRVREETANGELIREMDGMKLLC